MGTGNTLILDAFWVDNHPFPSEEKFNSKIGQTFHNEYSGNARHLGWMDMILLKELIKKNSVSHIILQNLDVLGKVAMENHKVLVCTSYLYKGYYFTSTIPENRDFHNCKPLYRTVEYGGWDFSEDDSEIPIRAQHYLRFLLIHTKVKSVSYSSNKVKITAYFDEHNNAQLISEPI